MQQSYKKENVNWKLKNKEKVTKNRKAKKTVNILVIKS